MRSKYEIKAQKELEADGWLVDNKAGMGRFSKNRDYWNLFDLMAQKMFFPVRFISIKGHQGIPKKHYKAIKKFWLPINCRREIWYWPKNKKKKQWIKKIL